MKRTMEGQPLRVFRQNLREMIFNFSEKKYSRRYIQSVERVVKIIDIRDYVNLNNILKYTHMLLLLLLLAYAQAYSVIIPITTDTTQTITNFKTDLAQCNCDVIDTCDNFCCCDTSCATDTIANWQNQGWCREISTEIENYCENLAEKGYSSFEDLGCVIYSNRGAIGYFYDTVNEESVGYPTPNKFAYKKINSFTLDTQSGSTSSSPLQIIVDGTQKDFIFKKSGLGSQCVDNNLNFMEPGTYSYSCLYPIHSVTDCLNINSYFEGTLSLCVDSTCTQQIAIDLTNSSLLNQTDINAAVYDSSTGQCSAITKWDIQYSIGFSNGQYTVQSIQIVPTTQTITKAFTTIQTNIVVSISNTEQSSGNPGYIIGKPLLYTTDLEIKRIYRNSADKTCATVAQATTVQSDIIFGIDTTFVCQIPENEHSCGDSYYTDQISGGTVFEIRKYGNISLTDTVKTEGVTTGTCSKETITLNILYSSAGWVLDPQYYIIASKITTKSAVNALVARKYFQVKWIYVSPDQITTPPTNYFYQYFSYLWIPLKSNFYNYLFSSHFSAILSLSGFLFLLTFY